MPLMSICNRQSTVTLFERSMMTVGKVSLVLLGLTVSVSWKGKDFIEVSRLSSISYGTNLKSLFTKIIQGSVDSKPTSLLDEERFLNCFGSGGGMDFFCMWREWMQVGFSIVKIACALCNPSFHPDPPLF